MSEFRPRPWLLCIVVLVAAAAAIGVRDQQAHARIGLGHAHHALANLVRARQQYRHALVLSTDLGLPDAHRIRACITAIDDESRAQR